MLERTPRRVACTDARCVGNYTLANLTCRDISAYGDDSASQVGPKDHRILDGSTSNLRIVVLNFDVQGIDGDSMVSDDKLVRTRGRVGSFFRDEEAALRCRNPSGGILWHFHCRSESCLDQRESGRGRMYSTGDFFERCLGFEWVQMIYVIWMAQRVRTGQAYVYVEIRKAKAVSVKTSLGTSGIIQVKTPEICHEKTSSQIPAG
jgi:hypothetical protein